MVVQPKFLFKSKMCSIEFGFKWLLCWLTILTAFKQCSDWGLRMLVLRGIQEPPYNGVAKLSCGGASHLIWSSVLGGRLTVKHLDKQRRKYEIISILQGVSTKVTLLYICNCYGTIRCTLCININYQGCPISLETWLERSRHLTGTLSHEPNSVGIVGAVTLWRAILRDGRASISITILFICCGCRNHPMPLLP